MGGQSGREVGQKHKKGFAAEALLETQEGLGGGGGGGAWGLQSQGGAGVCLTAGDHGRTLRRRLQLINSD